MNAVVLEKTGDPISGFVLSNSVPIPSPSPSQLLLKVKSCALNPVDYKMAQYNVLINDPLPLPLGCDVCGEIIQIGSDSSEESFKVGDLVFGYTGLGTIGYGTFAEFCVIEKSLAMKTSNGALTHPQLSSVGVGLETAALGLFQSLSLTISDEPKENLPKILIWGASSSVGMFAVQLASICGYPVIAVCSESNFDFMKSLGATYTVSYRDSNAAVNEIRSLPGGPPLHAYSTISSDASNLCAKSVSGENSIVAACAGGITESVDGVESKDVFLGMIPKNEDQTKYLSTLIPTFNRWFDNGKLKPGKILLMNGLQSIVEGLSTLSQGKVSGEKIVISLEP
mmetsp:Transcript_7082/g.12720  ORF Transcript_7082/g.12720 Transcript_7082/m.12720 type:complete len:339 (-) Transcript_7082:6-1022(-)